MNNINEYGDDDWATPEKENNMENINVGIDAFNDLAKSHDAHVKEVERLQKELEQTKNTLYSTLRGIQEGVVQLLNGNNDLTRKLKLIDQNGELLLECRIGDEYHRALLELGMTKLLKEHLKDSINETV